MTTPPETPSLKALANELFELMKREAPPPADPPSTCEYEGCDDDPQVVFKGTHFCPYHALINLLIPAGPTVVQQALQDAHPLWQVQVIAVPPDPGPQVPADTPNTPVYVLNPSDYQELGERDWIFTFGSGHELHGESLAKAFVRIHGTAGTARRRMIDLFGIKWSHQYATEEAAGVQQFGLTELPLPDGPAIVGSDLRGLSKEPRDG